jgi:threonine dehydratase
VFVCSVGVHTASELKEMQERMESSQLETHDLSDMDLVKDHFRHLVNFIDELPSF